MPDPFRTRALRVLAEEAWAGVPDLAVIDDDRLEDDLGLDSLDRIDLLMACEEEFATRAPLPGAVIAAETVGEFLALLEAALGKEGADA